MVIMVEGHESGVLYVMQMISKNGWYYVLYMHTVAMQSK